MYYWIPQRCELFLNDYFQLQERGHRITRHGKTLRPRYYNGWTAHRNSASIWMQPNWWRMPSHERSVTPLRHDQTIAHYDLTQEILFINVDDLWYVRGRQMREYLMRYCRKQEKHSACVSFGALDLANVGPQGIVPTLIEGEGYKGRTPEVIFKTKLGRRRYIGGWDHNDRIPRYFMAQLPKGAKAHTFDAARRSLAPKIVREAWDQGVPVVRQGDVFAIKTELREKDLKPMLYSRGRWSAWWPIATVWMNRNPYPYQYKPYHETPSEYRQRRRHNHLAKKAHDAWSDSWDDMARRMTIHGTAHTATEVMRLKDGRMFGRGMLRHDPNILRERRMRDHQNVKLDDGRDGWWLFARNTVPPA